MKQSSAANTWSSAEAYERRVGRWSRLVGLDFLDWLRPTGGMRWLDIGCGTGVLCQIILEQFEPAQVTGLDPSQGELAYARTRVTGEGVNFLRADAHALPFLKDSFDLAVSGLVLNHLSDKVRALAEMRRVVRPGGRVASYVWDYAGEMQLMRRFWDAAIALDPAARERDQARRFPDCKPEPLATLFAGAGLHEVEARAFDVATILRDFDDYWAPMTIGEGAIPEYVLSLTKECRASLRERLQQSLPTHTDGTIHLAARAWAVSGVVPR